MLVGAVVSEITGALALASVTETAGNDLTWLAIIGFANGLASALVFVGSQMLINRLVPRAQLQRAVSLDSAGSALSRIAGPALGGILLAAIGVPPVFLIAACCFVPLLVVLAVVSGRFGPPDPANRPRLRKPPGSSGTSRCSAGRSSRQQPPKRSRSRS
jgi:MFS family permease